MLLSLSAAAAAQPAETLPGRWSVQQARDWAKNRPWYVGCNFIPSNAINQLEMFQADTFDPATLDRELGLAQGIGFNAVRVYLHDLLWTQDRNGFLKRLDAFLDLADKRGIVVMPVLLDSCWIGDIRPGRQPDPLPRVHNSGWAQSPSIEVLSDPAKHDSLKPYFQGVMRHFANDRRILMWDLYNEPDNGSLRFRNGGEKPGYTEPQKIEHTRQLLLKAWAWAREVNPSQPLTTGAWRGNYAGEKVGVSDRISLANSDVITFHNYQDLDNLQRVVGQLKPLGRPIVCTEYMCRPARSTFETSLEYLKDEGIGAINWGLVAGKTNTIYSWDSWEKTYTAEPEVWFHDIFRPDGTPYSETETAVIRELTGAEAVVR